ncbi:DUF3080 family protein [Pseudoalteromonas fenneropenaei]|uniref:DUF3080 family protein n=2 Tax=Pseudoalteromonas fenneropenaei TaxID=1737459 RepID=A0ABV7CFR2_9GAMM
MLQGCDHSPASLYLDYQKRLANVSNGTFTPPSALTPLPLATKSKPEPQVTIGLLELSAINHCPLSTLIAEHNSQLGKVAAPSELFKYQLRFILQAPNCIASLQGKQQPLADKLEQALEAKKQHLLDYFNYMLYQEVEFRALFSLANQGFSRELAGKEAAIEALAFFNRVKSKIIADSIDNDDVNELTSQLAKLHRNTYVKTLLTEAQRQREFNLVTTATLATLPIESRLCVKQRPSDTAQFMHNVFQKFYIGQLQPLQADISGELQALLPLLYELYVQDAALSNQLNVESKLSLLTQLKMSAKSHVEWWQSFYQRCAIKPY